MKQRILFMGTPDFAVPSLRALADQGYELIGVVTQPDRKKGRKGEWTPSPVKVAATEMGIPVYQPVNIREPEQLQSLLDLQPDLVVTAAYGQILPNALLEQPTFKCINLHASLLPKYRGGAPIHWAIYHGEANTGITIMYMEERLDSGAMLMQQALPIGETDDVGTLHWQLSQLGAEMLLQLLPKLLQGEATAVPQDERAATYAPNIKREDELIDWQCSAQQLDRHVRAFRPWPGTFTYWRGKLLKLWQVDCVDAEGVSHLPGTILSFSNEGISVATGKGVLQIQELQVAGKKKMSVAEFLQGSRLEIGERLGG